MTDLVVQPRIAKVWIARYALSVGITEAEVKIGRDRYVAVGFSYLVLGRDCFESREDAVKRAEELRAKKLASMEKQRQKLIARKF